MTVSHCYRKTMTTDPIRDGGDDDAQFTWKNEPILGNRPKDDEEEEQPTGYRYTDPR